jgi:hypothetical protein
MKMESQPNDWTIQLTRIEKKFTVLEVRYPQCREKPRNKNKRKNSKTTIPAP